MFFQNFGETRKRRSLVGRPKLPQTNNQLLWYSESVIPCFLSADRQELWRDNENRRCSTSWGLFHPSVHIARCGWNLWIADANTRKYFS